MDSKYDTGHGLDLGAEIELWHPSPLVMCDFTVWLCGNVNKNFSAQTKHKIESATNKYILNYSV